MIRMSLKNIGAGLLMAALIAGAGVLSQSGKNAYAATTVPGSNEVIAIGGTTDGLPVNAPIGPQGYSSDGNIIAFTSLATNLPNAGGSGGLYIYNIKANTTARVDMSTSGTLPNGNLYWNIRVSETGRYVTFGSLATNLIDGTTTGQGMYYKRDTQAGTTTLIGGYYGNGWTQNIDRNLAVSNDGRFSLLASRLKANGYPNNYGIVLGEDVSGTYTWTSLGIDSNGGLNSANSAAVQGDLSCDGSFAAFQQDYLVRLSDLRRGSTIKISVGQGDSTSPIISCNGRYVLYATTNRTQITPTPSGMDTYMHLVRYDRITGERMYVDSNSSGVFSTAHLAWNHVSNEAPENLFNASIADTGDVVFNYNGNMYLKHLSDGSGTLEAIAKTAGGTYVNVTSGKMTEDGRYTFFMADPYDLGLAPSASSAQLIRAKTGL